MRNKAHVESQRIGLHPVTVGCAGSIPGGPITEEIWIKQKKLLFVAFAKVVVNIDIKVLSHRKYARLAVEEVLFGK
jgi:hypothetical protein